ncbi:MAG: toll/interleukin-1 receptor domain-containing protein [Methylococcales bacterium]
MSHSHLDATVVERLGELLEDEENFRVWLDKWVLVPGNHWQQEMAKGLDDAKSCAVCIGQQTPRGWFKEEIERALNLQTKDDSFRVIPIILPGGDKTLVDDFLELRTWVDLSGGIDDSDSRYPLVCGIKGIPPGRRRSSKEASPDELFHLKEKLHRIKQLRLEQFIDDVVALEYQRRLLDQFIAK